MQRQRALRLAVIYHKYLLWKRVSSPSNIIDYITYSPLLIIIELPEYLYPEVYANKHATRVVSNILGPRPEVHFIRSNTLLATDERQLVHADLRFEHPEHPFAVAYNTCLIDCGPENGTTELWLGTQNTNLDYHREVGEPMIAESKLEERRKVRGPCYPSLKRGSIVLRDLRLW